MSKNPRCERRRPPRLSRTALNGLIAGVTTALGASACGWLLSWLHDRF
ncbi:hypothetical protein ACFY3G_51010 [Streptomyces phaeochromogenes]|nr:hypothetical protein [Streptomyces phaeochromogenes]